MPKATNELFLVEKDLLRGSSGDQGDQESRIEVDLEDALDIAGVGKYQLFHWLLSACILSAAMLEVISGAFIIPAAACDLDVPENLKGLITCLPNLGIIVTAMLWGRVADSIGRKSTLLISTSAAGLLGMAASLMPNLLTFALCKFGASLFLSCPSSLGFAYAGEMIPRKRRDLAVLMLSAFLTMCSTLSPVLAWIILPGTWRVSLGLLTLRPWRLLAAVYVLPLIICAVWTTQAKESPKFLLMKGMDQEALDVIKHIYRKNTGKNEDSFPVLSLKKSKASVLTDTESGTELTDNQDREESWLMLFMMPHVKWLLLTGFLMFGVFCFLNGLFLFAPDTINKVMSGSAEENGTICLLITQMSNNETTNSTCSDSISTATFSIMAVTTFVYALVQAGACLSPLSKKTLLVATYTVVGGACLMAGLVTNRIVAAAAMSAMQLTAVGVGPLTAYAVTLFPTALRGTAVGVVMMCGRVGSVVGANVAGVMLDSACQLTFYCFAGLLGVCALLSCALPKQGENTEEENSPTE